MNTHSFSQAFDSLFQQRWGATQDQYLQGRLKTGLSLIGQTKDGDERHLFEGAMGVGTIQLDEILRQIRQVERCDVLPHSSIWWEMWHQRWEIGGLVRRIPDLTDGSDWRWAMDALFPKQSGSERWLAWVLAEHTEPLTLWDLFCPTMAAEGFNAQPPHAKAWLFHFLQVLQTRNTRFSMSLNQRSEAGQWLQHWSRPVHPTYPWFHLGVAAFIQRVDADWQAVEGQQMVDDGGWNQRPIAWVGVMKDSSAGHLLPIPMQAAGRAQRAVSIPLKQARQFNRERC